ncbi:MAG: MOSC domain-containing protein [Nitrospinaceae bacterium]|jgi:MOSC domain-containing protein YiiM|nr:MOSC domain-containing protein [Nitrospinaceae bacterium]
MKILSVNIGSLREVIRGGKKVQSGIFKQPVEGSVEVRHLGLEGDHQGNKKVHGGIYKAVYLYPSEHYGVWRDALGKPELSFGDFGENLTALGLMEDEVCLGDRFRIGSAELAVTQPREPCATLSVRMGLSDLPKRFRQSGRSGFYLSVVNEGSLSEGDSIECVSKDENRVSVAEFNRVLNGEPGVEEIIRRTCKVNALPEKLKDRLLK